jgi:hypothetical protein
MATATQKQAGKSNIRKAQRSPSRPGFGRRGRAKPGTRGGGQFFRIEVAPARRFVAFRYHDVGKKRGVERIAGQRQDGTWETAGWLIIKTMAHVERGRLVPDTAAARKVLAVIGAVPRHRVGDRFVANNRVPPPHKDHCATPNDPRGAGTSGATSEPTLGISLAAYTNNHSNMSTKKGRDV